MARGKTEKKAAIFLDRDGVIVVEKGFNLDFSTLDFCPGALEGLRAIGDRYLKIVVSNQSGIARNYFTESEVCSFNKYIDSRLRAGGIVIDGWYYCPHGPDDNCSCRKPKKGMIVRASNELGVDLSASWLVGDKSSDIRAGQAANLRTILVKTGYGGLEPGAGAVAPDYLADNLYEAVKIIMGQGD